MDAAQVADVTSAQIAIPSMRKPRLLCRRANPAFETGKKALQG